MITAIWVNGDNSAVAYRHDEEADVTICRRHDDGSTIAYQVALSGLDSTWFPLTGNEDAITSNLWGPHELPEPPDSVEDLAMHAADYQVSLAEELHPADFGQGTIMPPSIERTGRFPLTRSPWNPEGDPTRSAPEDDGKPWTLQPDDVDPERANTPIHTRGPLEGQPIDQTDETERDDWMTEEHKAAALEGFLSNPAAVAYPGSVPPAGRS